jgi:hypothetical protein
LQGDITGEWRGIHWQAHPTLALLYAHVHPDDKRSIELLPDGHPLRENKLSAGVVPHIAGNACTPLAFPVHIPGILRR